MDMQTQRTGGPVSIRPFRVNDIDPLFEAARESIAEITPWLAWCHPGYSREESAAWVTGRAEAWANGDEYSFAIVDAADGRFLGGCGLNQIHPVHRLANLGYWVRTSAAGRGVATAATLLVARFAFVERGLIRVETIVDVDNAASLRVAGKVKATRARINDAVMFSLIPEDLGLDFPRERTTR
jgi:RimJ/RimL family protein N-acetyltransferase